MENKTEGFNKNYSVLKEVSEILRNQSEPDIDELIPMLEKATSAYKACKSRLESVKIALKEHLTNEDKHDNVLAEDKQLPISDNDLDEDIPF